MYIRENINISLGEYSCFLLIMKFQIKVNLLYYFTPNRFVEQNKNLKVIAYYWEHSGEVGMATLLVT